MRATASLFGSGILIILLPFASEGDKKAARPTARMQTAFPGAEGFGATVTGGRGGGVYHVTNLKDSGPGSLREAVSKDGRTVVFDVGGYVELESILHVASDITIAGQTAPGDGIGAKGHEVSFSGSHNVIVRYIRFRQGATPKEDKKCAVAIHDGRDMIFDHVSIQFGRWDTVGMTGSSNITIQHSIIGPGVAPQRFGCLCESDGVTFSHNLWVSNHGRNPKAKGKIQFINNVVYNWEVGGYDLAHSEGVTFHDIIGNNFMKGPATGKHGPWYQANANDQVFAKGNILDGDEIGGPAGVTDLKTPWADPPIPVTVDAPLAAYEKVVAGAGCSLRRDAVDTLLIKHLTTKKGKLLDSQTDLDQEVGGGGFGELRGGPAPRDSDGDGIPDAWETAHGLDPHDAGDGNRLDKSGYTMLEVYLASLVEKEGSSD